MFEKILDNKKNFKKNEENFRKCKENKESFLKDRHCHIRQQVLQIV